jgi:hypothetical protein
VQGLLEVLLEQFGVPLNEDTLNGLKVTDLKTSSALAATPVEALKLVAKPMPRVTCPAMTTCWNR